MESLSCTTRLVLTGRSGLHMKYASTDTVRVRAYTGFMPVALYQLRRVATANVLMCVSLLILASLLLFRLSVWPTPWFDEGLNLATASTLADQRAYALPNSDGLRIMDPAIQTGPPVIVPVALSFAMFGAGILQARLVMVAFSLAAAVCFLLLARRMSGNYGVATALVFLALGTGDTFTSFLPLGRQVLGEIPSLGLLCAGFLLLTRHMTDPERRPLLVALGIGFCFGLAMVIKSQVALTLPVALLAFGLLNLRYYQTANARVPFVALGCAVVMVAAWYLGQILIVGFDGYEANRAVLREGFQIHIAQFSIQGTEAALRTLWSTGFVFWGVPSLAYGAVVARRRNQDSAIFSFVLLFVSVWLAWYVVASIGWSRYAAIALLLTPLFTGRLLRDLALSATGQLPRALPRSLTAAMLVLVIAGMLLSFSRTDTLALRSDLTNDHNAIVGHLATVVAPDAIIETWAWELDPFVSQRLHHPSTSVTNAFTLAIWENATLAEDAYDPGATGPVYVLENAFSTWTGIYTAFIEQRGTLVAEFGEYRLYRID